MKKRVLLLLMIALMWMGGCDSNNSYDGTQLIGSSSRSVSDYNPSAFVQNVQVAYASSAKEAASALAKTALDANATLSDAQLQTMHQEFALLLQAMKRTEALYIAGDYNRSLIDTLTLVDIFHVGKDTIYDDLDFIATNSASVESLLFKSSYKSINALEYLLYQTDGNQTVLKKFQDNSRYAQMVAVAADAIALKYASIEQFYRTGNFLDQSTFADAVLNAMVDSSYKLKEWRLGDPGGFTNASSGNPDAALLEYPYAKMSLEAMLAVLSAYERLFDDSDDSFAQYCNDLGAQNEVQNINSVIITMKLILLGMKESDAVVSSAAFAELYNQSKTLNSLIVSSLVAALQQKSTITIGIIEADGD